MTAPAVTSLNKSSGSRSGGTTVVITGTTLTGATSVLFGATPAISFTVNSSTQITCVSPAHVTGLVDITVTTPGGTSTTGAGDQFTYNNAAPTISSLNISSGSEDGGDTVIITGTNLYGATSVRFGATAATSFTANSDIQITCTSPAHADGLVDVTVVTPDGTSATGAADHFTFAVVTPTITSVTPSSGNETGDVTVALVGTNFSKVTSVLFGSTPAVSFTIVDSKHITAVSPALVGNTHITATNTAGTSTTGSGNAYAGVKVTSTTYVQQNGNDTAGFVMDIEVNPATLHSGALFQRLDPVKYPQKGVIHAPKQGTAGSPLDTPPLNVS